VKIGRQVCLLCPSLLKFLGHFLI